MASGQRNDIDGQGGSPPLAVFAKAPSLLFERDQDSASEIRDDEGYNLD
jgi:hypothetical protein